ncbi:MAG: LLM class flavin-dependent oxidoreductase [Nocardioidaceae bacterium]|nr:LLM class flavin-dependent oxidoreductase [Nocardioidaceae bacterium]
MARTGFAARYDFRALGADRAVRQEIYARSLEQAAYLEQHGHQALLLSEHHVSADGYLPSPLPVAAAFAAVTSTIPISVSALLLNLYDPLRVAEEIAVLDQIAAGRVTYTIGLGYRREEYDLFGKAWETRGADIEEKIGVLRQAWTGEEFSYDGRRVRILPTPYVDPHPFLFYGGGSPAAARRAARLGLGFAPQQNDPALVELYRDECRAHGREPGFVVVAPPGPANVFCAEDPDRFWAAYGHHLLADARSYASWAQGNQSYVRDDAASVEELRRGSVYVVLTPDEMVAQARSGELRLVSSHPACGGLPAEPSWESLRLICEKVRPALS